MSATNDEATSAKGSHRPVLALRRNPHNNHWSSDLVGSVPNIIGVSNIEYQNVLTMANQQRKPILYAVGKNANPRLYVPPTCDVSLMIMHEREYVTSQQFATQIESNVWYPTRNFRKMLVLATGSGALVMPNLEENMGYGATAGYGAVRDNALSVANALGIPLPTYRGMGRALNTIMEAQYYPYD